MKGRLELMRSRFIKISNKKITTEKEDEEYDILADDKELYEFMYNKGDFS